MRKKEINQVYKYLWIVKSICVAAASCIVFDLTTSNVLPLIVGALFAMVSKDKEKQTTYVRSEKIAIIAICSFYTVAMILANIEDILAFDGAFSLLSLLVCIIGMYAVFDVIVSKLIVWIRNQGQIRYVEETNDKKNRLFVIGSFCFLMICWLIGLAVSFPGNTTRDSRWIIYQALGKEDLSVGNPIVHTFFVRYCWQIGQALFGTANGSMAFVCFVQMLFTAIVITYFVYELKKNNIKNRICVLVLLFYGIVPYNVQMSHTIWKDVPFASFVLLFMILLWKQYTIKENDTNKIKILLLHLVFIIAGLGMCLLRNNGYYAYLMFIPFGIVMFMPKKKLVAVEVLVIFVLAGWIQGPGYDKIINWELQQKQVASEMASTEHETSNEMQLVQNASRTRNSVGCYIITLQQLARVVVDRGEVLTSEEYQQLDAVFNVEMVTEKYDPYRADAVLSLNKGVLSNAEYLKLWARFGIKYPFSYLLAWRDSTYGYWYPDIQYWMYTDAVKENEIGLYKQPLVSEPIRELSLKSDTFYLKCPIYGMVYSIGAIVWITILAMGVMYAKNGWKAAFLYIPLMGIWMSLLIASPVYAEFRYIYSFFLCLPISLLLPFLIEKKD